LAWLKGVAERFKGKPKGRASAGTAFWVYESPLRDFIAKWQCDGAKIAGKDLLNDLTAKVPASCPFLIKGRFL
jgi:hypothetical protein